MSETTALVIPGLGEEDIGSLMNVGSFPYFLQMVEQIQTGKCPFCYVNRTLNKVEWETPLSMLWKNPVSNKKHQGVHALIVPKRHVTTITELTREEWCDVLEGVRQANEKFGITGGALIARYGDPKFNAGSIRHLHFNIQVPDGTGRLEVTLAKDPKDLEEKKRILSVFEKMRLGTSFDDLLPGERELVAGRMEVVKNT